MRKLYINDSRRQLITRFFLVKSIIVAFTIERAIVIYSPFLQKRFDSKRFAWLVMALLAVGGSLLNMWVPFLFHTIATGGGSNRYCDIERAHSSAYFKITIAYIILIMLVPIVVIFVCNSLIIFSLVHARNERQHMQRANTLVTTAASDGASLSPASPLATTRNSLKRFAKSAANSKGTRMVKSAIRSSWKRKFSNPTIDEGIAMESLVVKLHEQLVVEPPGAETRGGSPARDANSIASGDKKMSQASVNSRMISRIALNKNNNKLKESRRTTRILVFMSLSYAILNLPYFFSW